jgi:SWI/SNF-related matrix-associated actin-dependent regulator 1 of chromatin subfamily A
MIGASGRRRSLIAISLGLVVGIGFGLRSPDAAHADPAGALARTGALADVAEAADAALARLSAELGRARDHARRGAALTVSGEAPAPELTAAADVLAGAGDEADGARRALVVLDGMAAAIRPDATVPSLTYGGADLEQLAAQLRSAAVAATLFVARRHATQAVVDALAAALAELDGNDPAAALDELRAADAPLALLAEWKERPPLLRYWMMISAELLDAAGDIARATLADDPQAVEAAAARYAEAADAALGADNAVAVALSEEGAAVTVIPLQRLAALADEAAEARAALPPVLQPAS